MGQGVLYGTGCAVWDRVCCMGQGVLYGTGCAVWDRVCCMGQGVLYGTGIYNNVKSKMRDGNSRERYIFASQKRTIKTAPSRISVKLPFGLNHSIASLIFESYSEPVLRVG